MFLDAEGQRLMVERNNAAAPVQLLGPRKSTLTPADAAQLARMQTNRQARAVLGAVAQVLRTAYEQHLPLLARVSSAGRELQAAMTSRLNGINNYAQRVYTSVPDDDAPVSPLNRKKIEMTLAQARDAANDIDQAVQSQQLDIAGGLADLLTTLLDRALSAIGDAIVRRIFGDKSGSSNIPKWVKIAVGGTVALIFLFIAGKLVHTIMLGGAGRQAGGDALLEAEEAAVALMGARLRKPRRKR